MVCYLWTVSLKRESMPFPFSSFSFLLAMMAGAGAAVSDCKVNMKLDAVHSKEVRQKPLCLFLDLGERKIICYPP